MFVLAHMVMKYINKQSLRVKVTMPCNYRFGGIC